MRSTVKSNAKPSAPVAATVSLAHAKANLSSIITGVHQKHKPVTILRRGIPVVQIIPFPAVPAPPFLGSMIGKSRELGDIVSPTGEEWVADWPWPEPNPNAGPDPDDD